jgi:cell division protein ZapA
MDKNQIRVDLLGKSFSILCDERPEHLKVILDTLQQRITRISRTLSVSDPLKIALLAGIDLADELIKLRKALRKKAETSDVETEKINSITNDLIDRINRCLS